MNGGVHPAAARLIDALDLAPHPEGGWFRETWRSDEILPGGGPNAARPGPRACGTSIYYLLAGSEVSRMHRLRGDEVWHFHAGTGLVVHLFPDEGIYRRLELGPMAGGAPNFQSVVPAGCAFGATIDSPDGWALVGCTLAPGFDRDDFELIRRVDLAGRFADQQDLIHQLTR